jgi:hypothetical protein
MTADPPSSSGTGRARWSGLLAIGLILAAVSPVILVVVTRAGRHYLPVQDFAVIDLRVRDVFTRDVPLVGPYSRYGWDHPGPLVYWLVAPFSALFGRPAWATQVGFALLQGAAAVWLGLIAWRRRGLWAAAFWLAVLCLSVATIGPPILLQPWGPNVTLAFFALFCCLVWLVRSDDTSLVVQAALVGSLLVQTHLGYAPLVLGGAVLVLVVLRRSVATWSAFARLRSVRWALLVSVVMWLPALLETVLFPPGNLAQIAYHSFVRPSAPKAGLATGLGLLAGGFRLLPAWLGGHQPANAWLLVATPTRVWWLALPLVVLGLAGWLSRRAADEDAQRLVLVCAVMLGCGAVALAGLEGPPYPYLFYWVDAVAAMTLLTAIVCVARCLPLSLAHRSAVGAALVVGLGLVVFVRAVPLAVQVAKAPIPFDRFEPATAELLRQLDASDQPTRPVMITVAGTALGGVEGGIIDQLARQGAPIRVAGGRPYQFGRDRVASPSQVGAIWYVIEESDQVSLVSDVPGAKVIAQVHPLGRADEARLTELQRKLAIQLEHDHRSGDIPTLASPLVGFSLHGVPGLAQSDLNELGALNVKVEKGVCECSVISLPPSHHGGRP